jgi:RNA polymerase sigma factor (sigma-70 family)
VEANPLRHHEDVQLARGAAGGSLEHWHEFVLRYSGLILSVVRRYLAGLDRDEHRNTYVDTLESFFRVNLSRYNGETTLASWVITVTRSRCLDALRAAHGRKRLPSWLSRFSESDREVYRLYFVEQLDAGGVAAELARSGRDVGASEVAAALGRLDAQIDRRSRTRMAYELHAQSVGRVSARLLEYLDHARLAATQQREDLRPDVALIEAEARDMLVRIRAGLERLPEPERSALRLRFDTEMPTSGIATQLGLPNRRAAQALIDKAIATLRRISLSKADGHRPGNGQRPKRKGGGSD